MTNMSRHCGLESRGRYIGTDTQCQALCNPPRTVWLGSLKKKEGAAQIPWSRSSVRAKPLDADFRNTILKSRGIRFDDTKMLLGDPYAHFGTDAPSPAGS